MNFIVIFVQCLVSFKMSSNTLNRKRKQDEISHNLQSSYKSSTFFQTSIFEETNKKICQEQTIGEELIDKFECSTFQEDKAVLKAFRRHAISKVNELTLQSLYKFIKTG